MTAIYRKTGDIIDYTPSSAAVDAGEWVVQGSLAGITKLKIEKDKLGAITTSGLFDGVTKATGALTLGQVAWLNPTDKKIYNASASGYLPVGLVTKAAASADTECQIFLCPTYSGATDCPEFAPMANVAAASAVTGVELTDSTGGTSYTNHTLKAVEDSYTKATIAGNLATLATQVDANRIDIAALQTKLNALISGMVSGGLMESAD